MNIELEIGGMRFPATLLDDMSGSSVPNTEHTIVTSKEQTDDRGGYLWLGEGHTSQLNK